jgi:hypothetical protein
MNADIFDDSEDNTRSIVRKIKTGALLRVKVARIRDKLPLLAADRDDDDIVEVPSLGRQSAAYKFAQPGTPPVFSLNYKYLENPEQYLRPIANREPEPLRADELIQPHENGDEELIPDPGIAGVVGNGQDAPAEVEDDDEAAEALAREVGNALFIVGVHQEDPEEGMSRYVYFSLHSLYFICIRLSLAVYHSCRRCRSKRQRSCFSSISLDQRDC